MNPICALCKHGSCGADNKFDNTNRKRPLILDVEYPSQDFGAVGTNHKQVHLIDTIDLTKDFFVYNDCKILGQKSNKIKKLEFTKNQLEEDLKELRNENAKLNEKIVTLGTSMDMLTEELRQEKDKNANLADEFNTMLLEDEDNQCSICFEVFIKPSLLNCSHMFCEWCIETWLETHYDCPICRVEVVRYTPCLNMNNFIEKMMQLKSPTEQLAFKERVEYRATEKEKSLENRAEPAI